MSTKVTTYNSCTSVSKFVQGINLDEHFKSNVPITTKVVCYWKIYEIQNNPKICIKIAKMIKDNQFALPEDGNYQTFALSGNKYLLPYFDNTVTINSLLGELNITTLSYQATSLHGFRISIHKGILSNTDAHDRFTSICRFLESASDRLENSSFKALNDSKKKNFRNGIPKQTDIDYDSDSDYEPVHAESGRSLCTVILLSVFTCGGYYIYKTCIEDAQNLYIEDR